MSNGSGDTHRIGGKIKIVVAVIAVDYDHTIDYCLSLHCLPQICLQEESFLYPPASLEERPLQIYEKIHQMPLVVVPPCSVVAAIITLLRLPLPHDKVLVIAVVMVVVE